MNHPVRKAPIRRPWCPAMVLVGNGFLELQLRGVVATGNGMRKANLTHLCEYLMLHGCCKVIKSVVGAS
jgi:hypothetical protein